MAQIKIVDPAQATGKSKELLTAVQSKIKSVPNLEKALANCPAALRAWMEFDSALDKGSFNAKLRQEIALAVGQKNGCEYCVSQAINADKQDLAKDAKSNLTKLAAWINERNIPFLITSIGMIVMLLWAGSFKMTAPGAEGIVPLVSNSPLIWWHFKLFGPYIGSDIIGLTEIAAAILFIAGYMRPKAGIVGGFITTLMFFITITMFIITPGSLIYVPAIHGIMFISFFAL